MMRIRHLAAPLLQGGSLRTVEVTTTFSRYAAATQALRPPLSRTTPLPDSSSFCAQSHRKAAAFSLPSGVSCILEPLPDFALSKAMRAAAVVPPQFSGCRTTLFATSRPHPSSAVTTMAVCTPAVRVLIPTPRSVFFNLTPPPSIWVSIRDFSTAPPPTDNSTGNDGPQAPNPPPPPPTTPDLVPNNSTSPLPMLRVWSGVLTCVLMVVVIVALVIGLFWTSRGLSVLLFIFSTISGTRNQGEVLKKLEDLKEFIRGFSQSIVDFVEIFPHQFMVVSQQLYDAMKSEDNMDDKEKVQILKKILIAVLEDPEVAEVLEKIIVERVADKIAILEKEKQQQKEKEKRNSWFPWW